MKNFIYEFVFPFFTSYGLTCLISLLLINKAAIMVSKSKPELEGFHKNKETIPNVGGIAFVLATFLSTAFFAQINTKLLYLFGVVSSFGVLGFIDDFYKRSSDNGDGITSKTKLFWQFVIAIFFVLYGTYHNFIGSGIPFLMKDNIIAKIFENLFLIFLLVYFVNAFNITDGLDGLAGSVSLPLCVLLILIAIMGENNQMILVLSISLLAALVAFLHFNKFPARYFMGDCGSMALGSTLLIIALSLKISLIFIIASLMLSVELFTSLIQIVSINIFKKKVFTIAPIHHLFEKKGESEIEIVNMFSRLSALFSIIALLLYCYLNI